MMDCLRFYPATVLKLSVLKLSLTMLAIGHLSPAILAQSPTRPVGAEARVARTGADRPNMVWIMSEDNSANYLRHFDPTGAPTPNIESLAKHGITFDRAFSNAPVCSVARTTLFTSCYGPRIGTQFHRRMVAASMPESVQMFPAYLREAGYYTTNDSKQDYNVDIDKGGGDKGASDKGVWDESSKRASWKNRPEAKTPFFHVVTSTISHESSLHFPVSDVIDKPAITDPSLVALPPYFPDTTLMRYTIARYHDRIAGIDRVVGQMVEDLELAGELENTFIFYFGDHGGVLPRSKGYAFESGLHVPLVIRVPDNFKSLIDRPLASRTSGFVEFVDFGPTALALAGVASPASIKSTATDGVIDGTPFLGPTVDGEEVDARDETIGYADRFDEKYDLVRTLRKGDFKYIRNFEPFLPDGLQNNYRYEMAAYRQWRTMHQNGKLDDLQSQFFRPKSVEALYDLSSDPHEGNNLAGDPAHAEKLIQLRTRLTTRLKGMPDLSFIPETFLVDEAMSHPVVYGQTHKASIAANIDIANLALLDWNDARPKLIEALQSDDVLTRYWGTIAASSFAKTAAELLPRVTSLLQDPEPIVVARAVEFVAIVGGQDPRPYLYRALERSTSEAEALQILGTAVFLDDHTDGRFPIEPNLLKLPLKIGPKSEVQRRLDYLRK